VNNNIQQSELNSELLKRIKAICLKQNIIIWLLAVIHTAILFFVSLQLIFTITLFEGLTPFQEFFLALGVRVLLILLIIYLFLKSQKDEISINTIAYQFDQLFDDKSDTISNALDFYLTPTHGSNDIKNRYINQALSRINSTKFNYNFFNIKSLILMLVVLMAGTAITFYYMPDNYSQTWKLFRARRAEILTYNKYIQLKPQNVQLSRNSNLRIEVIDPEKGAQYVLWTSQGEVWKKENLDNASKLMYHIENSFHYCIKTQYGSSDTFYVQVIDEPVVKKLHIKINYPSYTKIKPSYFENTDGNITVLKGSDLSYEIETDISIKDAKFVINEQSFSPLKQIGKTNWSIDLKAKETYNYFFTLTNKLGIESKPIIKTLNVITDTEPRIDIVFPQSDTVINQNMKFSTLFQAVDDFGLQNLKIHYQINDLIFHSKTIKNYIPGSFYESTYMLDLDEFMLFPGDIVTYWLEVEDNSPLKQKGVSKRIKLTFPSMDEIFKQSEKQENINKENLEMVLKESKKLQDEFEKKRRELLRKNEPNADDKSDVQQLLKKQDDFNKIVDNVANEYQKMIKNLENNNAINEDIIEKMQKIQEIMEEITSPELQDLLKEMQRNINQMSPDQLKKTMEDFKFSLEDFNQRLQQTLDLLESIKKEMALQKLSELAKEMEKMQASINEKTKDAKSQSDLSKEQQQIKDMLEKLQDEINKSKDLFDQQKDKEYLDALDQLSQDIDQDGLMQDLEDAIKNLEQNNKEKAQKSQKSSLQKMAQLSQKLEKMRSSMGGSDAQEMIEIVQNTIKRLLLMSKLHEDLNNRFVHDPLPIMPEMIANYDAIQLSLKYLYSAPQILMFLGQKYFYDVSETQNAFRAFFSDIQDNKLHTAKTNMQNILKGLNLIIFDLMQTLDNMSGGGGGGSGMQSLMQQLQQMGQEQLAMNMLTQSMMEQMMQNGNQMSQQMRQQMQRLASEEQRLADNLNRALQTNPEAQKHTQQIKQLTEELEAISRQLKQGKLDKSLLDRQNNIMSKLLDIEKSIQKREHSQKRKGETGRQEDWDVPDSVKNRFKDQLRRNQLQEELKAYPKEYQDLIKEYLKSINE